MAGQEDAQGVSNFLSQLKRRLAYATTGFTEVEKWRAGYERVEKKYRVHVAAAHECRTNEGRQHNQDRAKTLSVLFGMTGDEVGG